MAGIISNIVQNSLSGFVNGAVTTAGGYAGSAVNGMGDLLESGGKSVGDGIANSFQSWGNSINSYGTAARNATAPNGSGYAKRVEAKSKPAPKIGEKKALPSTRETKALPSTKPLKALPAPPAKKDETKKPVEKAKSLYQPTGDSYKSKSGAYQAPTAKKREVKSRTLQSGKVVASKESLPQSSKAKTAQSPAPAKLYPAKASSLNLPPASPPKPAISEYGFVGKGASKAPGKAGSVVGGQQKNFSGHIPGFGGERVGVKASSRALTVVGSGNKIGSKSKAGSVVESQAGGGPKFF